MWISESVSNWYFWNETLRTFVNNPLITNHIGRQKSHQKQVHLDTLSKPYYLTRRTWPDSESENSDSELDVGWDHFEFIESSSLQFCSGALSRHDWTIEDSGAIFPASLSSRGLCKPRECSGAFPARLLTGDEFEFGSVLNSSLFLLFCCRFPRFCRDFFFKAPLAGKARSFTGFSETLSKDKSSGSMSEIIKHHWTWQSSRAW